MQQDSRTVTRAIVEIGEKKYTLVSDDQYLKQIQGRFEPKIVKLFKTVANNSEVILDIGANIGCTALLFSELAQQVYAFEPAPSTFHFLKQNIDNSGLDNIALQNIGLGAEPGEFTLTFSPANRSGGFVSNRTQVNAGHVTEKIMVRQLDEVLRSLDISKVDFIKIDVEGFERQVLQGATQALSTYQPTVVLELNHWCLNVFQRTSIPDFLDFLRSQFPILLAIDHSSYLNLHDEAESYTVMYHHVLQGNFPNILAAFDESRLEQFRKLYKHGFTPNSLQSYLRSIKRRIGF